MNIRLLFAMRELIEFVEMVGRLKNLTQERINADIDESAKSQGLL